MDARRRVLSHGFAAAASDQRGRIMSAQVAFICSAPAHRSQAGSADKLTIHEGQWAFCPHDAKAEGHKWDATGGRPLFELRDQKPRTRAPRDASRR